MQVLKIGIIGAGGIVLQRHLPGLRKLPAVEIAAAANSTPASAAAFCEAHAPEAKVFDRWQDLAASPELDIVWIGATPHLHHPATLAALEAGKHVFCQARMARDLGEAQEMLAAAEARPGLVTMLCPPPQGLCSDAFVRQLLAQQVVGEIRHLRLQSFTGSFLDPAQPAHWRQRREISGQNILTLGIHTEVLQRWFGDFTVKAAQGRIFTPERGGYRVEIPDCLQVLAGFANGAAGTLEFSGVHPGEPIERLEIIGSAGRLVCDYRRDEIILHRDGQSEPLGVPPTLRREWQVEADFIHAMRNPSAERPHPDFRDGLRYMRVVQAVGDLLARDQA